MLCARSALDQLADDLGRCVGALAALAEQHRQTIMVGRTLTQHAVPITFGLKAAGWLDGVLDALDGIVLARKGLRVQCGGAAGTLAAIAELADDHGIDWSAASGRGAVPGRFDAMAHPPYAGHRGRRRAGDHYRCPRPSGLRYRRTQPSGDRRSQRAGGRGSWRILHDAAEAQPGAGGPDPPSRGNGAAARFSTPPRLRPGRGRATRGRLAHRVAAAGPARPARRRPPRRRPPNCWKGSRCTPTPWPRPCSGRCPDCWPNGPPSGR